MEILRINKREELPTQPKIFKKIWIKNMYTKKREKKKY